MDTSRKIVTLLPLQELWNRNGVVTASRGGWLSAEDIANLLRKGCIQFVVADLGRSPLWIALDDCYLFWKNEAKPHLSEAESKSSLADFPDGYCYLASAWNGNDLAPIVVLEKYH